MPEAKRVKEVGKLMAKLDENGDGKLSFGEFNGYFNEKLAQIKGFKSVFVLPSAFHPPPG